MTFSLCLLACGGEIGTGDGSGGGGNGTGGGGGGGNGGGGGGGGGGGAGIESCKRVDLVISVDDSGSMQEEMDAMRNDVFPGFAQALRDVGGGLEDYRIGVVDACPSPASFHKRGDGGSCNFSSNEPWMQSNSSQLTQEFSCVGDIYSGDNACSGDNDDEQPASAAAAALEAPMLVGGPNTGFLRDDALLVVIAITDEDEQPTPSANAQQVYDRLVALKGGNVNKMVFLGIGGGSDCNGTYGSADNARMLQQVSGLFAAEDQGLFWDLCNGRLEDGLAAAMGVIEDACDDFCNDPDGCDPGTGTPPGDPNDPPDNPPDECRVDNDCATGEFCEGGKCYPVIN